MMNSIRPFEKQGEMFEIIRGNVNEY